MGVIPTNKWLEIYQKSNSEGLQKKMKLHYKLFGEKIAPYFSGASPQEVHQHLLHHGLFEPMKNDQGFISSLIESDLWDEVKAEYQKLRSEWHGPDVPIFLLPMNVKNSWLKREVGNKSGVSFQDKVFLFVSPGLTSEEVLALLIHEYHHVCRLNIINEEENEISLVDSVIIEGLAECAVEQRLGNKYLSPAVKVYSRNEAIKLYKRFIKPNLHLKKGERKHVDLLYGKGPYPKWLGYCAGYHLVSMFAEKYSNSITEITTMPSQEIVEAINEYIS